MFTNENTYLLYTAIGSAGGNTSQFYVSIYPPDFPNTQRTDIYFRMPFNPPAPGTYAAPSGFSYDQPGLTFQGFGTGVFCDGGTFTVHSVNTSSPWGLEYELSWSQSCNGSPVSGHAAFTAVIPPDTRPPVLDDTSRWEVAADDNRGRNGSVLHAHCHRRSRPEPDGCLRPTLGHLVPARDELHDMRCDRQRGQSSDPVQIVVLVLPPDTTPPQFYYMPDIVGDAIDPRGATVDVYIIATDERGEPVVNCRRAVDNVPIDRIGSALFPVNAKGEDTLVTCVATDPKGNQTEGSFAVHIRGAGEQVENLIVTVRRLQTSATSATVCATSSPLSTGCCRADKKPQACGAADNFIRHVDKEEGQGLYDWQAWHLRTAAQQITTVAGKRYDETVQVQLYKSGPNGFELIGTLQQSVPVRGGGRTTDLKLSYTFTSADAALGKVTFKAVAGLLSARDALPADNEAVALPTKVSG